MNKYFSNSFLNDFESLFNNLNTRRASGANIVCYRIEKDGVVTFMFDLPGCKRADISAEFTENGRGLSVSAKRTIGEDEFKMETTVAVPATADIAGDVQTAFVNGVLTVDIPPKKEAQPRKLTIME